MDGVRVGGGEGSSSMTVERTLGRGKGTGGGA